METSIINNVVIIDDNYKEAMPIIQSLAIKGISSIYWDGNFDTKPEQPLVGVRLLILDMRFSYVNDSRSVVTHLITLIKNTISIENGPYILCIWSKHDNEYLEDFKKEIWAQEVVSKPYLIINLEKSNYIKVVDEVNEVFSEISSTINTKEDKLRNEILEILENNGMHEKLEKIEVKENAMNELYSKLELNLKETNSLAILLMWENIVNNSARSLVNSIAKFSEINETWDNNIKTLIQHLAIANAGKSFEGTPREYIINSLISLNQMLPDELWNQLIKQDINDEEFNFISNPSIMKNLNEHRYSILKNGKGFLIKKNKTEIKSFRSVSELEGIADEEICKELYNKYLHFLGSCNFKLLCEVAVLEGIKKPGGVYKVDDSSLLLDLSKSIFRDFSKIEMERNCLVKLDISSACDYAQNKLKKIRWLPGIIIEDIYFSNIDHTDDIYCTPELKVGGKTIKIAFNFHYITSDSMNNLGDGDKLFSFRDLFLTDIKHKLSTYISRVGILNI